MKKRISAIVLLLTLSVTSLVACGSKNESTTDTTSTNVDKSKEETSLIPVTLNEVAHSIFYAPMYVAIEEGCFALIG